MKYPLLELRQYLEELKDVHYNENNNTLDLENMFAVFGTDNSFMFALKKQLFRKQYLVNYFTNQIISRKGILPADSRWYDYEDFRYYVASLNKLVPSRILNNITRETLTIIEDTINKYLYENPEFIKELFNYAYKNCEEHQKSLEKKQLII